MRSSLDVGGSSRNVLKVYHELEAHTFRWRSLVACLIIACAPASVPSFHNRGNELHEPPLSPDRGKPRRSPGAEPTLVNLARHGGQRVEFLRGSGWRCRVAAQGAVSRAQEAVPRRPYPDGSRFARRAIQPTHQPQRCFASRRIGAQSTAGCALRRVGRAASLRRAFFPVVGAREAHEATPPRLSRGPLSRLRNPQLVLEQAPRGAAVLRRLPGAGQAAERAGAQVARGG